MGLLEGKTALIFGVANQRSIAWGITQAFHEHGARIGISYAGAILEKRVLPLAESIGSTFVEPCDVTRDEEIEHVRNRARETFGEIDILVHAIAFAGREELDGPYYNTTREGFKRALDISVYSFTALARVFQPMMPEGSAMVTLSHHGGPKVFPHYNVMGVAKAALEASVRYLANDLGPQGIRVNAISAGPVRTLAAAGVAGFKTMYREFARIAPLRQNITIEDIGKAAVYLCSDLSSRVTGEVHYVDGGYNILGVTEPQQDSS